jgi:hypothetical protein
MLISRFSTFSIPGFILLFATIILLTVSFSCKKIDRSGVSSSPSPSQVDRFFQTNGNINPVVLKVINNLKKQNQETGFIKDFANEQGFAIWDKSLVSSHNVFTRTTNKDSFEYAIIPLQLAGAKKIHGALICRLNTSDTVVDVRLIDGRKYQGWDTVLRTNEANAFQTSLLMMQLNKEVFGIDRFIITDTVSVKGKPVSKKIWSVYNGSSVSDFRLNAVVIQICVTILVPNHNGQVVGCPASEPDCPAYHEEVVCESYNIWYDDEEGGGGGPGNPDGGPGGVAGGSDPWISGGRVAPPCESGSSSGSNGLGYTPVPKPPIGNPFPRPLLDYSDLENPVDVPEVFYTDPSIQMDTLPGLYPFGRNIGRTEPRNNIEDMTFGYDHDSTDVAPMSILGQPLSTNAMFNKMTALFYFCTFFDNELETVGNEMIDHFKNGNGEAFESAVINRKVKESGVYRQFVQRMTREVDNILSSNGDDPSTFELPDLSYNLHFDGMYHKFHGLQILVNNTESTEIYINNFQWGSNHSSWTADFTFVTKDHFGLDKHDAVLYQSNHTGFAAWWWLQHRRNYKPFETSIVVQNRVTLNR